MYSFNSSDAEKLSAGFMVSSRYPSQEYVPRTTSRAVSCGML
jgi:hypothetical protein